MIGDFQNGRDDSQPKIFIVNPAKAAAPSESRRSVIVELIAVENQTALRMKKTTASAIMKTTTLSAIVLGGLIAAATAHAGDYRYANGGYSGRACESTTVYVQPSQGYYHGGYAYGSGYSYDAGYGQHRDLHQDLQAGHRDLHVGLRDSHQERHWELQHERSHGASRRELRALHHETHHELSDAHWDGHAQLRNDHRAGHYDLGW